MNTYMTGISSEQVLTLITKQAEPANAAHWIGVYLEGPKKLIYSQTEGGVSLRLKPGHWGSYGNSGGRLRVEVYEITKGTAVQATFEEDKRLPVRNNLSIGVVALLLLAFACVLSDSLSNGTFQPGLLIGPAFLILMLIAQFAISRAVHKAGQEDERVLQNFLDELLKPYLV